MDGWVDGVPCSSSWVELKVRPAAKIDPRTKRMSAFRRTLLA